MNRTGYLHDDRYLLHDTGKYHPEMPQRLNAIHQGISQNGLLEKLAPLKGCLADFKYIEAIHEREYITRFEGACVSGRTTFLHPDNQMCFDTFSAAQLAAGGVIEAVRQVMAGELDNAFCAVRPPGHHAERAEAMGFCYFNNIAIAANYLLSEWNIKRVGIIDFDVHHGNGTQHIFEDDPRVFYYSIHEHPSFAFPGTGRHFEEGRGAGLGFTRNIPILPGQSDDDYQAHMEEDFLPTFDKFKPEVILASTGFDAHEDDDMSGVSLTTAGYSMVMRHIMTAAEALARGRIVSILEGGYCLPRLPELAHNHVSILLTG
ncbi:MAG: histone deacetylase [Desulfobacterales bacterium]